MTLFNVEREFFWDDLHNLWGKYVLWALRFSVVKQEKCKQWKFQQIFFRPTAISIWLVNYGMF